MRIISYNILDGGEGRADPLAEVILAQRPDIVALVEADNPATLQRIASRLKMDFIHAPGNKSSAALLSKWPIERTINRALLGNLTSRHPEPYSAKDLTSHARPDSSRRTAQNDTRGIIEKSFLEVAVSDANASTWTIGVVHLHAHAFEKDEKQREEEIAVVLDAFADRRARNLPHLLVGDFNSNAPYQLIDPKLCTDSTKKAWRENGDEIPRRVIGKILDAGYIDTLRAFDPKESETAATFTTLHPGQRVDYIFAFGFDVKQITDAWIEHDRLAKYASDHFPIGAEIEPPINADKRR